MLRGFASGDGSQAFAGGRPRHGDPASPVFRTMLVIDDKELGMPAIYHHAHFNFLYPENWLLSESDSVDEQGGQHISLESPSGGMWMLSVLPAAANPETLVREAKSVIDEQFENVDWSVADATVYGDEAIGLDGFFYSLDLLVGVKIRCVQTLDRTFVIVIEAESHDLDQNAAVFDAISYSLIRSTTSA